MTEPAWGVDVTPRARRDLRNLDPHVRKRVVDALERLVGDPSEAQLVRLKGSEDL